MSRFLVVLALLAASKDSLAIRVSPSVVFAGNTVRVTCHVPRQAMNRWLNIGIVDYRDHAVQLDGDAARVTHEIEFDHIPCVGEGDDVGLTATAYCRLVDGMGREQLVTAPLKVAGCSAGE